MPVLQQDKGPGGDDRPQRVFEALPAGAILLATVLECFERDSPWWVDDKNHSLGKKREVSWKFEISDDRYPEYKSRYVWGSTSAEFSTYERCKLRLWVEEIFASDFNVGFQFDYTDLVGQQVNVVIGNRNGKNKDGEPVVKDFVESLLRAYASVEPQLVRTSFGGGGGSRLMNDDDEPF